MKKTTGNPRLSLFNGYVMDQRKHLIGLLFLAIYLACSLFARGEAVRAESDHFIAEYPEGTEQVSRMLLELAEAARNEVHSHVSLPLEEKATLVYYTTERGFLKAAGLHPEHFLACAAPSRMEIHINGELVRTLKREEIYSVLVHEYAHLYIGQKAAAGLPRWLDEGLAMHLAGEWSLGHSIRLATAQLFGKLIPFSRLEAGFPPENPELRLAYTQSYSMTRFVIRELFGGGGLDSFLRQLSDPVRGTRMIYQLENPLILRSLENQWKQSLGGRVRNLVFLLTSSSLLWFALATLFLLAYVKKRKQVREQIEVWENEDYYD